MDARPHPRLDDRLNHPADAAEDVTSRVWDLLVLGGGTAGIVAARTAASMGARVLLVERDRTGGDCLFTGCVPSKALLAAADAAAGARRGARLGVHVEGVRVDFAAVMAHVHEAVARIAPVDSPAAMGRAGVTVVAGRARLTSPGTAEVDGRPVRFAQAVLCTGAAPTLPPVPGLADVEALTSENVWDLADLPRRLVVLGAGTIGCELGQAMARLGARVSLVEAGPRVLPGEEPEAAATLTAALREDGVDVLLDAEVVSVEAADGAGSTAGAVLLADGRRVEFDRVLVAVGRTPRTADLGLEEAGVDLDAHGHVVVDEHLRTTNPRVWAAGDLTGHPQLTHVAGVHGSTVATNAVLGLRRSVAGQPVPRVTYTQPEVAAVGMSPTEAAGTPGHRVVRLGHEHVDRAVAEGRTEGSTSLVLDRRGRVVGASVVGPRAGETLGELVVAVGRGLRARDLAGITHAYPTYNDGAWNGAISDLRATLGRPAVSHALRTATRARRRWLSRRDPQAATAHDAASGSPRRPDAPR